ncbi:MAG: flagellar hook-length control protein FliK [Pseudomonadota bacterium]
MDAANVNFNGCCAGAQEGGGGGRMPVKKRKDRESPGRGASFSSLAHAGVETKVPGTAKKPPPAKGSCNVSGEAAGGCRTGGWADLSKGVISGSGPDGSSYLSLRVESAGRGTLGLEIVAENGKAHLRVTALSGEACEWVKGKQPEIASIFEQGGISLEGMTVSSGAADDTAGENSAEGIHAAAQVKSLQEKTAAVSVHGPGRAGHAGELIG